MHCLCCLHRHAHENLPYSKMNSKYSNKTYTYVKKLKEFYLVKQNLQILSSQKKEGNISHCFEHPFDLKLSIKFEM